MLDFLLYAVVIIGAAAFALATALATLRWLVGLGRREGAPRA